MTERSADACARHFQGRAVFIEHENARQVWGVELPPTYRDDEAFRLVDAWLAGMARGYQFCGDDRVRDRVEMRAGCESTDAEMHERRGA